MATRTTINTQHAKQIEENLNGTFRGRSVYAEGETIVIYGSKGDGREFRSYVASLMRNHEPAATARQINYLKDLAAADPGYAATVGVPANMDALTKDRASDLIEKMLEN